MPYIPGMLQDELERLKFPNHMFMMEDHRGKGPIYDQAGSRTSEKNKRQDAEMLRDLYLKPGCARFHKHFVTVHWEISLDKDNRLGVRDILVQHLRNFKRKLMEYKDHGGCKQYEVYYSGKWTGDKNDDFVSGLMIACRSKREFWLDKEGKYKTYQRLGEQ